jgi:hypothetical protein
MKVQSPLTPTPLRTLKGPQGEKNPNHTYDETDVDKNRVVYETAYNLSRGMSFAVEGGARAGQAMQLGGALLGLASSPLAGSFGLAGGAIDVARGASLAQQSAINRNRDGAILGTLQVAQGLSAWVSAGAVLAGAPAGVAQAAAVASVGLWLGREGFEKYAKGKADKPQQEMDPGPKPEVSVVYDDTKAKPKGEGKLLVRTFGLAKSVNDAASQLGNMAAGWNNVAGAWTGDAPTGVWAGLGVVGSTYSLLQGAAQVARSAGNRNLDGTLQGTLGIVQGAASMAVSMGVGGHLMPAIAVGAWVAKQAVPLLQLKKRLGASDDGGDDNDSFTQRLKENWTNAFSGGPEEIKREAPKAEEPAPEDDQKKPQE